MKIRVVCKDEIRPIEDSPHVQVLDLHEISEVEIEYELEIGGLDVGEQLIFVIDE